MVSPLPQNEFLLHHLATIFAHEAAIVNFRLTSAFASLEEARTMVFEPFEQPACVQGSAAHGASSVEALEMVEGEMTCVDEEKLLLSEFSAIKTRCAIAAHKLDGEMFRLASMRADNDDDYMMLDLLPGRFARRYFTNSTTSEIEISAS